MRALVRLLLAMSVLCTVKSFKLKTHMVTANKAIEAIIAPDGDVRRAYLGQLGSLAHVEIRNPFVVDGVRRSPKYFRAGVCGPDCFPDLGQGQLLVHVNRGCERVDLIGLDRNKCFAASSLPFERRRLSAYRSVDYGMALLAEAWAWRTSSARDVALLRRHGLLSREALAEYNPTKLFGHSTPLRDLSTPGFPTPGTLPAADVAPLRALLLARQHAVVFAYGFLGHMIGDSFAHSYVNEWQRGTFDYFGGRGGPFGALTEEMKHVGVEGFIDHALPKMRSTELEIAAPKAFLNFLFRKTFFDRANTVPGDAVGPNEDTVAGNFGGPFFTHLLSASATLRRLSDHRTWTGTAARRALKVMPTWMVRDVEYFLKIRGRVIEAMLDKWVALSECVAQNIIQGANRHWSEAHRRMERIETDACRKNIFEATAYERELFEGTLDQAAWGTDFPSGSARPAPAAPVADHLAWLAQEVSKQQARAAEAFKNGIFGIKNGAKLKTDDFGTLGGNLGKIFAFVKASAARFFRFNLIKVSSISIPVSV